MGSLLAQALEVPTALLSSSSDDHGEDEDKEDERRILNTFSASSITTCPSSVSPSISPIAEAALAWQPGERIRHNHSSYESSSSDKSPNSRSNPIPIPWLSSSHSLSEQQQRRHHLHQDHHDHVQSQRQLPEEGDPSILLPLHSDFTVPTSNVAEDPYAFSPPPDLNSVIPSPASAHFHRMHGHYPSTTKYNSLLNKNHQQQQLQQRNNNHNNNNNGLVANPDHPPNHHTTTTKGDSCSDGGSSSSRHRSHKGEEEGGRRSVFGASVGKRYVKPGGALWNTRLAIAQQHHQQQQQLLLQYDTSHDDDDEEHKDQMTLLLPSSSSSSPSPKQPFNSTTAKQQQKQHRSTLSSQLPVFETADPASPPPTIYNHGSSVIPLSAVSPLTPNDAPSSLLSSASSSRSGAGAGTSSSYFQAPVRYHQGGGGTNSSRQQRSGGSPDGGRLRLQSIASDYSGEGSGISPRDMRNGRLQQQQQQRAVHETIHAQSLLLGLAFMAVWMPNNAMAPNLTQMAAFFKMSDAERDLYLGSYCALAVGVFSLPIAGLIGFLTDFVPSRKMLYVYTCLLGAMASALTGWSPNYATLLLGRLLNGGCMSGSVPVAFSLLGDLFAAEERNAASSGLTAMMGCGILVGQVYAGVVGGRVGSEEEAGGWSHAFFLSSGLGVVTSLAVLLWVQEPVRGGKEKALMDLMEKTGTKYDRKLTWQGFVHAMQHNRSNALLIWQGFFTSLPWGIVYVFLNDFLSQEKGFSVPDATVLVMLFGIGCAVGGITGGAIGQALIQQRQRRYLLPLFMAATTWLAILPFLLLLNVSFVPHTHNNWVAMMYTFLGGVLASLPSVSVRPCIINVNPPETRGAALTAANLMVTLARGMGPCCITVLVGMFPGYMNRRTALNITLSFFWTLTSFQLLFLAKSLPLDEDAMEAELANFAAQAMEKHDSTENLLRRQARSPEDPDELLLQPCLLDEGETSQTLYGGGDGIIGGDAEEEKEDIKSLHQTPERASPSRRHSSQSQPEQVAASPWLSPERSSLYRNPSGGTPLDADGETSVVSIEERMTSFDNNAARQSIAFMQQGIREIIQDERLLFGRHCGEMSFCGPTRSSSQDEYDDENYNGDDFVIEEEVTDLDSSTVEQRRQRWLQQQKEEQQRNREHYYPLVPDLPGSTTTNTSQQPPEQSATEETPLLRPPV
jgi:MFS family permease